MKAMAINRVVSLRDQEAPLAAVELPVPEPEAGEIRIKVCACGVCHTELDEIEGCTALMLQLVRHLYPDTAVQGSVGRLDIDDQVPLGTALS